MSSAEILPASYIYMSYTKLGSGMLNDPWLDPLVAQRESGTTRNFLFVSQDRLVRGQKWELYVEWVGYQ
jgi:hypothetical protein